NSADWGWIQHMLSTLNVSGRMFVVLDNGVLFRGNSEAEIRKRVVEADLLEAVIGLPSNLFYNTSSSGCILVLNKSKPPQRRGKVLFIYGAQDYLEGRPQNYLRDEDVQKHIKAFIEFRDVERYCKVVPLEAMRDNDFSLNITLYLDVDEAEQNDDPADLCREVFDLENERSKAVSRLTAYVSRLGLGDRNATVLSGLDSLDLEEMPPEWNVVKLRDVIEREQDIVGGPFGSNLKVSDYQDAGRPIIRLCKPSAIMGQF